MDGEIYRMKLGRFECAIVNDGTYTYKEPGKVLFENAPHEQLVGALKTQGIDLDTWTEYVSPYPSLVVDTGDHLILVDTGMGDRVPTTGRLAGNLQAAGFKLEDFDFVILTHVHPDHAGGNLDGAGRPAYPNARYVLWDKEWEFWTQNPDLSALRDNRFEQMMLDTARTFLPPIAQQVMLVQPEAEIVPGVAVIPAPGHTPGQMAVLVSSAGEHLLAATDAVLQPAQFEHPDWYSPVDLSPAETVATRWRLLARAADEQMLIFAPHFIFPSLGHAVKSAGVWRWEPI